MTNTAITHLAILTTTDCPTCGAYHAIPKAMYDHCRNMGGHWYCPNGHHIGWSENSLQKKLEREEKRRKWAERNAEVARADATKSERRRIAQKAANTRLKNRVKAGVCPCCNRTFKQLAAHMKNKHPQFNEVSK